MGRVNKKWVVIPIFALFCFGVFAEDNRWASTAINVRTGPGTSFAIMGQLYTGERIEVFNIVNGWAQIRFENVEGFVNANLLLSEPPQTPEEIEAARIAAELEAELEAERERRRTARARRWRVVFIVIGIISTILILAAG